MEAAGLYVHIPFCNRVCPYCDFAVRTGGPRRRASYLDSLLREIDLLPGDGRVSPAMDSFDTIYLGGGTPSCLEADQLSRILRALADKLPLSPDVWISLEANPEDVSDHSLQRWREIGIRTVSLGIQSFDDAVLEFLGRRHTSQQAIESVRRTRAAQFPIVAVDLIFGLPGQDTAAWRRQLDRVLELQPDHVSCYQLTIHEGTRFGKRRASDQLCELPESRQAELFLLTDTLLCGAGFEHYEVSNFAARPQARSRHNRKYWNHTAVLGLGPAAHSFDGRSRRWWNHRHLREYENGIASGAGPVEADERLTPSQLALESVWFGLRRTAGIDIAALRARTGIDLLVHNAQILQRFADEGLLIVTPDRIQPTRRGLALAEHLAREIEVDAPGVLL